MRYLESLRCGQCTACGVYTGAHVIKQLDVSTWNFLCYPMLLEMNAREVRNESRTGVQTLRRTLDTTMVCPVCVANAVIEVVPAAICAGLAAVGGAKAAITRPLERSPTRVQQQAKPHPLPAPGVCKRSPQPAAQVQPKRRSKLVLKPRISKLLPNPKGDAS
ncbi:hypothetical protein DUNSADRAFT_5032 [Dunaliella salina]|uniref:Encoded protein n=1 Tax=Dunaliella salina TaxID=3046 RepID=A0ABQ7HAB2_DUNSA|nr:hypothetical protein DUNSADRAFT_5032 [Dunaliella salina]|eukprot:KAF5843795.1 hypothetical protein DUNSADRAFT_5032 [Dunaliella salina]